MPVVLKGNLNPALQKTTFSKLQSIISQLEPLAVGVIARAVNSPTFRVESFEELEDVEELELEVFEEVWLELEELELLSRLLLELELSESEELSLEFALSVTASSEAVEELRPMAKSEAEELVVVADKSLLRPLLKL